MSRTPGYSIRIFIPSGEPEGLRIVEKMNWTGQGLIFPRSLFPEVRQRSEFKRTGVYILWGPSESGQLPKVYVGQGDAVQPRLDKHIKEKDFWTHGAVFISKDQNLNMAHVKHLESRLHALASGAKRCDLENGNTPQPPALSEADTADVEAFLADLLLCLPIVGVAFFDKPKAGSSKSHDLTLKAKGIEARGVDSVEGFIVRAGSQAVKTEVQSIHAYMSVLRQELIAKEVLVESGEAYKLIQDYTFNSPSTAAGVLLGRTANGRIEWKDAKGKTLKEIQEVTTGEE